MSWNINVIFCWIVQSVPSLKVMQGELSGRRHWGGKDLRGSEETQSPWELRSLPFVLQKCLNTKQGDILPHKPCVLKEKLIVLNCLLTETEKRLEDGQN